MHDTSLIYGYAVLSLGAGDCTIAASRVFATKLKREGRGRGGGKMERRRKEERTLEGERRKEGGSREEITLEGGKRKER